MNRRLIVVSNRIPTEQNPSGGLVVALHDTLKQRGGLWVGTHPDTSETAADELVEVGREPYRRLGLHLTREEYANYYLGFANSVLWPICHRRGDLVRLERKFERGYGEVNARIARHIATLAGPDDLIWAQDYHFFPLASELRRLGVAARLGFFLHIPFPGLGELGALPKRDIVAQWLADYDLVGLQTQADVARCLEMFRADRKAELMRDGAIKRGKRMVSVRSFPIGIDVEDFARAAAEGDLDHLGSSIPQEFVIGVDRLDYSKGIPNRFRAFGRYLERRKDKSRRVSLIQVAPPTREEVEAYREIRTELEEITGRVNGEHAELDWTPIRYIHRAVERDLLAKVIRRAKAGLVTSLADGMNLVAKEFVAAQDPADPGVLILSRMAGAAEQLTSALLVNPYDIDQISEAIAAALDMPLDARRRRHSECMEAVRATDVSRWSAHFLAALEKAPRSPVAPRPEAFRFAPSIGSSENAIRAGRRPSPAPAPSLLAERRQASRDGGQGRVEGRRKGWGRVGDDSNGKNGGADR